MRGLTNYIDVATVTLYAFWVFFAGLIFYLRREDKREGYPLDSDRSGRVRVQGFPAIPSPKTFLLYTGQTVTVPSRQNDRRDAAVVPGASWPGAPMRPTGNPMLDGVGPASYADRADVPEYQHEVGTAEHGLSREGRPVIVPMRNVPSAYLEPRDPDPRGMTVLGADGRSAGVVTDVWMDRGEMVIRYLQVALETPAGEDVLLPMNMARIDKRRRRVKVKAILARHFADVPRLANPERVTKREEDRIVGYYGGGYLYATVQRSEPLL